MSSKDLEFANNARNAVEQTKIKGAWPLLFFIILGLVAAVAWAAWAKVEQVSSGLGKVIPSTQIQLVENLEPGIVREINVSAGDLVSKGQILLRVDDTASRSKLGEFKQKQLALSAEVHRLTLQINASKTYQSPDAVDERAIIFHRDQEAIFISEKLQLEERISILESQLLQKRQLMLEAEATIDKQTAALKLAERELTLTKRLFAKKAVPELEYLRIQRIVADLKGEIAIMGASKIRISAEVAEAEKKIEAETSMYVAKARERVSAVNADLSVVSESLKAADDRVKRSEFLSPVSGIVNKVNVATIGEVVPSGATLVEIVPADDTLLIEARIRPEDIAFIRPQLKAIVRLTAYDYTKFGTLEGIVERIGADTITDENNETFYQVVIATDEIPEHLKIIPGMIATVDISTGDRTVLEYLLKPVLRVRDEAFRDPK